MPCACPLTQSVLRLHNPRLDLLLRSTGSVTASDKPSAADFKLKDLQDQTAAGQLPAANSSQHLPSRLRLISKNGL